MLIWVEDLGRQSHLTGFQKKDRDSMMIPVIHLIEKDNRWTMRALEDNEWTKMEVDGNGCADPLEYIERMMSPSVNPEPEPSMIMTFDQDDGESFQVWEM